MPKPTDYKAIALWGKQLGSYDYYIKDQQWLASQDNAPLDATYYIHGTAPREWNTVSELAEGHLFRRLYEEYIKP